MAKRETWREWVVDPGNPPLVTRAEVLAKADRLGLAITERTLRYWEAEGILPSPHVEKNGTPAQYPWWIIDLVYLVRRLQDERYALERIKVEVRARARQLSEHTYNLAVWPPAAELVRDMVLGERKPWEPDDLIMGLLTTINAVFPDFARNAKLIGQTYANRAGFSLARVSLLIETQDGEKAAVPLYAPTADPDS